MNDLTIGPILCSICGRAGDGQVVVVHKYEDEENATIHLSCLRKLVYLGHKVEVD